MPFSQGDCMEEVENLLNPVKLILPFLPDSEIASTGKEPLLR